MFKTILQSVGVSLASVCVGFISSIVLARLLGPEARGVYGSALTVALLIAGFSQLGLAHGYVFYRRKTGHSGLLVIVLSLLVILATAGILLLVTHQFFLINELMPYFVLVLGLTFANTCHAYFQNAAQIYPKLYFYNILKIILPLLTMLGLFIVFYTFGELTVTATISILMITTLVSTLFLAWNVFSFEFKVRTKHNFSMSDIMGYSSKIFGTSAIGIFINSIDKIVLLGVGSMKEFGLYSVAFGLSRMIGILPETMSTVIYSRFAGRDENELAVFVKRAFSILFLPLLGLCLVIAMMASWFIAFLFGVEYEAATWPFIILLFEAVISSLGWMLSQRFNAAGRPGLVFLRQIISTVPLIVIIFYSFGLQLLLLVSCALLVSSILRLLMTFVLYKKVLKEPAPAFYPTKAEISSLLTIFALKKAKDNNVS